jgi:hypothetical protein
LLIPSCYYEIIAGNKHKQGNKKMFMIGKRPLSEKDKNAQAVRFSKKIDNPKRNNAKLIEAMRSKLKAK